eukprot:15157883-Ditylum_brightwellii.AAC.1
MAFIVAHNTHANFFYSVLECAELIGRRAVAILVNCDQHVVANIFGVIHQRSSHSSYCSFLVAPCLERLKRWGAPGSPRTILGGASRGDGVRRSVPTGTVFVPSSRIV